MPPTHTTLLTATAPGSGDLAIGDTSQPTSRGVGGFIEWLLSLPATAVFAVAPGDGGIHTTPALAALLPQADAAAALAALIGCDRLEPDSVRRAAVTCGPSSGEEARRLWALVPVEADSGEVLLVGLLVGLSEGDSPAAQEANFQAALQEPDRRHGINQPLTALSFLLENLLHAFQTTVPDAGYRERKVTDLVLQLRQLRDLLRVTPAADE